MNKDDLIIIGDLIAIPRANIAWLNWGTDSRMDKELVVGLKESAGNIKTWSIDLENGAALDFWEQFTGQRVSWDDRPVD